MLKEQITQNKVGMFFCLCSETSFEHILSCQRSTPLIFNKLLSDYTNCLNGCGSCIDKLRQYIKDHDLYVGE